jgi:hypothetical protein
VEPEGPSLSLPLSHFAAAVIWLNLGAAALVAISPDLAAGNLFDPRVFATTHLFTLGVITTAILGAMYQFVPAVLGVGLRNLRMAWVGWSLLQGGVLTLTVGLWTWRPALQAAGWVLLFGAVGCSAWNLLPARRKATRNRAVAVYLSLAHSWLGMNLVLAAARIGDAFGWWHTSRSSLVAVHFHLGVFGFATLTIVGIGNRMIPAFLQAKGHPEWPFRWVGWTASAGLLLFGIGGVSESDALRTCGGILLLAGAGLYLFEVSGYFRKRSTPDFDPGLGFITIAHAHMALAAAVGAILLATAPAPGRWWIAYAVLAILGWVVMMILGVMHRVVQRLVTQQMRLREGARAARLGRGELLHRPVAWLTCATMAGAVVGLFAGISIGSVEVTRAATIAVSVATALVLWQGLRLARIALQG